MKSFLRASLLMLSVCLLMGLTSCHPTNKKQDAPVKESTGAVVETMGQLVVENIISTDNDFMFQNYHGDYQWFEVSVVLADYLDAEGQDGAIEKVTDVYEVISPHSPGALDTNVIYFAYTPDGVAKTEQHGFWIEDFPLNGESIKVTFEQAYNNVMSANYPKPHSRQCVLRKQVGPVNANPQYIFGNNRAQLYVDAVTGAVADTNPAFRGADVGTPLGEWP